MGRLVREDEGGIDGGDAVLIVTGSTLAAELRDRPSAYALREGVVRGLGGWGGAWGSRVIVCSDVWYLSHERLRTRPTVSIGSPEVSALSAYLAERLGTLYAVDGVMAVQGELEEGVVSCWGVTHEATARAVAAFVERYLGEFVRVVRGKEGGVG